ncbi:Glycosyltransferase [Quillaja saponaria]|uniref:Glycosyltransferase n=1 Tax=Quillaja saponaria TaxID=32244 RepID=A0AAD7LQF8_QUISA|nr:Glycosyltransferase [Quillaja saponaria]
MTSIISLLLYYLAFGVKLKLPTYAPQKLDSVMDVFGSLSIASLVSLLLPKSWWFIRQPQSPPLLPETFTDVISNTEISRFLHSTPIHNQLSDQYPITPRSSSLISQRLSSIFSPTTSFIILSFIIVFGVFLLWVDMPVGLSSSNKPVITKWHDYTLKQAVSFVARNGTVIVCAVSQPSLLFLNNWLISVAQQKHQDKVLVIAEDYTTLYKVNERWPGHAVLIPAALDAESAQNFGSEDFFNIESRRRRHLLQILDLGNNVMYNDVDMVWLADPFPYLQGNHDVYFTDDMAAVKPLNHSHNLPNPGKEGRINICSCMIFLRPTNRAKLVMSKWIEELQIQHWSKPMKSSDQPAFNSALNKTAGEVDLYLLPQAAFPTGGLYFKNKTWVQETKGMHVIIHNNYITGFQKKIQLFRKFHLWLVDDHSIQSPLGRL